MLAVAHDPGDLTGVRRRQSGVHRGDDPNRSQLTSPVPGGVHDVPGQDLRPGQPSAPLAQRWLRVQRVIDHNVSTEVNTIEHSRERG